MDNKAKQSAEVLLDFYAGYAASDDESLQEAAFNAALARFNEVDAFSVTMTADDEAQIEITPLLLASGVTMQWLVDRLASASERSEEEILFDLRHFIENL
jgi:hypothetical protein